MYLNPVLYFLSSSVSQDERQETSPSLSLRRHANDESSPKGFSRGFRNKLVKGISVGGSKDVINVGSCKDVSQISPKSRVKIQTNKSSPKLVRKSGVSSRESRGVVVDEQQKLREDNSLNIAHGDPKMHGREVVNNENYVCEPTGDSENVALQGKLSNMNVKSDHAVSKIRGQSLKSSGSSNNMPLRIPPAPPCTLGGSGSSIPKPTAAVKGTSKPTKEERNQVASPMKQSVMYRDALPRQKQLGSRDGEMGGSISVALVSPMPSENSSSMSESTYSTSTGQSNSNSSDSSVIYRPSSESGSEVGKPVSKKIETTFDNLDKVSFVGTRLQYHFNCF